MKKLLALALFLPVLALAQEAPVNVAAVRSGTEITVTWEHPGAPDGYYVYKGGTTNTFRVSPEPIPPDGRSYTLTGQPATGDVCGINVLARYVISQPGTVNYRSESVCATDGAPEVPNGELPVGEGSVTLTWTPPTEREDGSALPESEILGYNLYADTVSPPASKHVETSGNTRTYTYTGLGEGTWYFAAQTIDTDRQVSALSTIVSKDITGEPADEVAPVITLLGGNPLLLPRNATYVEEGAFCDDDVDGDLSEFVEITGTVDTGTPGAYALTYTCTDNSGNVASVNRAITVLQRAKPLPPALQGE